MQDWKEDAGEQTRKELHANERKYAMADLRVKVEFDASDVHRGSAEIRREIDGIERTADQASQKLRTALLPDFSTIRKRLSEVGEQIRAVGDQMRAAGQSMSLAITAPLVGLGTLAVKSALNIDSVKVKIAALVGGSDAAANKMRELQALADRSIGVTRAAAYDAFAQLKGIGGIADETINRLIASLGRLNAAFNIEDLAGFQRNLIQLFTQGFEMQDLKEALGRVPIFRQLLQAAFGTDDPQALKAMRDMGTLTIDQWLTGISDAIEKDPRMATLAESASIRLSKSWEKIKETLVPLGQLILDAILPAINAVVPLIQTLGNTFNNLPAPVQTVVVALAGLAAAAGPVVVVLGSIVSAIGSLVAAAPVIGIVTLAIVGLTVQLSPLIAYLGLLASAWYTNFGGIRDFTNEVIAGIVTLWEGFKQRVITLTDELVQQVRTFWEQNGEDIKHAVTTISDIVQTFLLNLRQWWKENGDSILEVTRLIWSLISNIVKNSLDTILQTIKLMAAVINGDWSKAWDAIKQIVSNTLDSIVRLIAGASVLITKAIMDIIRELLALDTWINNATVSLGKAIIDGMVRGIKAGIALIRDAARDAASAAVAAAKSVLQIQSPSRVAHELGQFFSHGLAEGIEAGKTEVIDAVTSVSSELGTTIEGLFFNGSFKDFVGQLVDTMASGGSGLRNIFHNIARNWRQALSTMAADWLKFVLKLQRPAAATPPFDGGSIPGIGGGSTSGNGVGTPLPASGGTSSTANGRLQLPTTGLSGIIAGIGSVGVIAGGLIGGRVGGVIQNIAGGALTGLMLGAKIGMIGSPLGAAIGAGAGLLLSLFGGLFGDPKRKRDKNEKLPALQRGFVDAMQQLRDLLRDVRSLQVDPDQAIAKAVEIRQQIASGFGLQFESKKYSRQAQQLISAKLAEADALIAEIRAAAEVSRAAAERSRRILPEFAGGIFISRQFATAFRRWNGLLPGVWTGRDSMPAMLAPGEMVLNPMQQARVRAAAGGDVFAAAGIPGYASGGVVQSTVSPMHLTLVFEHTIDADGLVRTSLKNSPEVARQLQITIEDLAANDRLRQRRRGA